MLSNCFVTVAAFYPQLHTEIEPLLAGEPEEFNFLRTTVIVGALVHSELTDAILSLGAQGAPIPLAYGSVCRAGLFDHPVLWQEPVTVWPLDSRQPN